MSETSWVKRVGAAVMLAVSLAAVGCSPEARFVQNAVYQRVKDRSGDDIKPHMREIDNVLAALFGTPDEPHVPAIGDLPQLVSGRRLKMAAGPVGSDQQGRPRGLYRKHCAHCHGVTGDGNGPTAVFLNPYPRDYRLGKYKFKTTPLGTRPTHEDLKQIVLNGIPGTAMPSFTLLPDDEVESLVEYVKYLSVRGESERALIDSAIEAGAEPMFSEDDPKKLEEQVEELKDSLTPIVNRWAKAAVPPEKVPPAPPEGWGNAESVALGKTLFFSAGAQCFKCHGDSALGDGQTTDFDDWTKEYYDASTPDKKRASEERLPLMKSLGAHPPRNIRPRNLRLGVYRGGRRPIDLYLRVQNGIEGTPMPGITLKSEFTPQGLTPDEIWHLIAYVRSMPYEPISNPFPQH